MKEKKEKVYAIDPVTGLKRINYCRTVNLRYRWDADEPGGVAVELPADLTDCEEGQSEN